jgi:hypothetical protein
MWARPASTAGTRREPLLTAMLGSPGVPRRANQGAVITSGSEPMLGNRQEKYETSPVEISATPKTARRPGFGVQAGNSGIAGFRSTLGRGV